LTTFPREPPGIFEPKLNVRPLSFELCRVVRGCAVFKEFPVFNPQAEYGGVLRMWCERRPSAPLIALASIVSAPGLVGWQLAETIACNQAVTGENKSELSELIQGFHPERDPLPAFRDSFPGVAGRAREPGQRPASRGRLTLGVNILDRPRWLS
jgi:hypothetical protein